MTTAASRRPQRQVERAEVPHERVPTLADPLELLTPDEVCALLKMKRTWFYAQVAAGRLTPIKLGRSTRVRRRDLEDFLALLPRAG